MNALLIAALLAASTISPEAALSPQTPEKPSHIAKLDNGGLIQVDDDACSEVTNDDGKLYIFVSDGKFSVSDINCAEAAKSYFEAKARPLHRS